MAAPVTDEERHHIEQLLNEGHPYAHIERETGRGRSTISRIAQQIGHEAGHSNLTRAHEARSAYSAERRAKIAARLTEEAEKLLDDLHGQYHAWNFGGRENTFAEEILDEPPVEAKRALIQSAREALRTVIEIDRHDNRADEGLAAVDQWLRSITGSEG